METPNLSLCMIVRDSARTLPACLESIRPWVDELIVVDTGSVDDTANIARQYGARVFDFPWCDDFSRARNESLGHATGRWLFWMDSDDTITAEDGRRLRALADGPHASTTQGYIMQVVCPGIRAAGESDCTIVDHVKMFRNLPQLRFEGRIHEQILPAIRRLGGEIEWTDIQIVHSGSDQSPAGRQKKQQRDLRILNLEHAERPEHPFTLFNLGMTYADLDDHASAIRFLQRSIEVSGPQDSHLRKAYSLLVHSLSLAGPFDQARTVCEEARQRFPDDPEILFRWATICHAANHLPAAEQTYKQLIGFQAARRLSSTDPTITGYKARQNLAAVYHDAGRHGLAELQWRQIVRQLPQYQAGWRGLVESLLHSNRLATAAQEIDRMLAVPELRVSGLLLRARLCEQQGKFDQARTDIQAAIDLEPADGSTALEEQCRFLFERGEFAAAHEALLQLADRVPADGAVFHNLGAARMRLGRTDEAIEAYRRSLVLRPRSTSTRRELAAALHAAGRQGELSETLAPADGPARSLSACEVVAS